MAVSTSLRDECESAMKDHPNRKRLLEIAREKIDEKWSKYVQVDPYKGFDEAIARGYVFMGRSRAEALIAYLDRLNAGEIESYIDGLPHSRDDDPEAEVYNHYNLLNDCGDPKNWQIDVVWHHEWMNKPGYGAARAARAARSFYPFHSKTIPYLMKLPKERGVCCVPELTSPLVKPARDHWK